MADTGVLLTILGLTVAVPVIGGSSLGPWFCYRLVPQSITSAITPCMFPCLFISRHEHPHIVVHSEVDGTPCKVSSGLHHETKVGRCSSGVCTAQMGPPVLKRKKRFICLLTLAKLRKAKRERKLLREELEKLRQLTMMNNHHNVNYVSGRGVSSSNFNRLTGEGSRGSSANNGGSNVLEIHVIGPTVGGTHAYNPGTESSVSVDIGNSVGGSNLGGNVRSVARDPGAMNLGAHGINEGSNSFVDERIGGASFIPGSTGISGASGRASAGVVGGDTVAPGARIVANIGVANNDAGGAHGESLMRTVGTIRAGIAGSRINSQSGRDFGNPGGVAIASSGSSTRNSAAAVAGIARIGANSGISGLRGPGSSRHAAGEAVEGNSFGISGVVSTASTRNRNNVGLGAGYFEASSVGRGTSSALGIAGARSPFPNSDGSGNARISGRGSGTELESGSSRGNRFFEPTGGAGDSFDSDAFWDDGFGSDREFGSADGF